MKSAESRDIPVHTMFWEFFKIGLFTIGGGLAMIPVISDIVVRKKGWLSDEEMIDCIALSQAVPGIIAINIATFVGYKKREIKGGLICTLGSILPSFLIILLLWKFISNFGENPYVIGAMKGIKAAIIGMIICVLYSLSKSLLKEKTQKLIVICVVVAVSFMGADPILMLILSGILGVLCMYTVKKEKRDK